MTFGGAFISGNGVAVVAGFPIFFLNDAVTAPLREAAFRGAATIFSRVFPVIALFFEDTVDLAVAAKASGPLT